MEYHQPALFKRAMKEFEDADAAHRAADKEYTRVKGDADLTAPVKAMQRLRPKAFFPSRLRRGGLGRVSKFTCRLRAFMRWRIRP